MRARAQRFLQHWGRVPRPLRHGLLLVLLGAGAVAGNWIYHVVHKPSELLFPLDDALLKSPAQTWEAYGDLFQEHSTSIMRPEFLAALAQVEASGNPVARTYWRFRPVLDPLSIYRPASSAVGMYQITDGTFELARRYCIRDHAVAEQGAWTDPDACWFNDLYTRVLPGDAIELTSAWLDTQVRSILSRNGLRTLSLARQQELAALVHLCGAGAGNAWARAGLKAGALGACGDHGALDYVARVRRMQQIFARLAQTG